MHRSNLLSSFAFLTAALLAACSSGNGSNSVTANSIDLSSFSVTGTNSQTASAPAAQGQPLETAQINSAVNSGQFTIAWATDAGSTLYTLGMYISTSESLSFNSDGSTPSTEMEVFQHNCNVPGSDCTSSGVESCQFTYSSQTAAADVICPANNSYFTYNIANYLTKNGGTGISYYLVMQACVYTNSQATQSCSTQAVPAKFTTM